MQPSLLGTRHGSRTCSVCTLVPSLPWFKEEERNTSCTHPDLPRLSPQQSREVYVHGAPRVGAPQRASCLWTACAVDSMHDGRELTPIPRPRPPSSPPACPACPACPAFPHLPRSQHVLLPRRGRRPRAVGVRGHRGELLHSPPQGRGGRGRPLRGGGGRGVLRPHAGPDRAAPRNRVSLSVSLGTPPHVVGRK